MLAMLDAPLAVGSQESIIIPMRVRSATLEANDHMKADSLDVEAEWSDAGIDPRFIRDANIAFYLGQANEFGDLVPQQANLRFVGVTHSIERHASDAGVGVSIKANDFTSFFLRAKDFPSDGVPAFSATLTQAWQQICAHTGPKSLQTKQIVSTVERMVSTLEFRGGAKDLTIGDAVPSRIGRLGHLVPKQGANAWDVWQQVVGSVGLVSFIELDKCIVTTTADLFDQNGSGLGAPSIVWGKNVSDLKETANGAGSQKAGVGLTSFDPLTGRTVEAVFPDPGDVAVRAKRTTAAYGRGAHQRMVVTNVDPLTGRKSLISSPDPVRKRTFDSDSYEWLVYPGVTDPDMLKRIAEHTWIERSHQEVEGSFSTAEMFVDTVDGRQFDMLRLSSGDAISIEIDPSVDRGVFATMAVGDRTKYLESRGYASPIAKLLAANAKRLMKYGTIFHTKDVRTHLETSSDGGSFSIEVTFWNRFELDEPGH